MSGALIGFPQNRTSMIHTDTRNTTQHMQNIANERSDKRSERSERVVKMTTARFVKVN